MKKIQIINGPNLNLLGKRQPDIYGNTSFESYIKTLKQEFQNVVDIQFYQSNCEGDIIKKIHDTGFVYDGIILNAAAYTHTSVAIADAIASVHTDVIEVHISNIFKREEFRHKSIIAPYCLGSICGFGLESYRLALIYLINTKN